MTKDLEETLAELGPGYREVVDRLRSCQAPAQMPRRFAPMPYLAAASVAAALAGIACVYALRPADGESAARRAYTAAYVRDDAALESIVESQLADGSWANDFLTRQNAAALRCAAGRRAAIAYKKAARYLKSKGLKPLTEEELALRAAESLIAMH